MSEKRLDIILGGRDDGASAVFGKVTAEAKKYGQVEKTLAEARREYLSTEAAAGSLAAAYELDRLKVAKEYTTQRERVVAILNSESADLQQRFVAHTALVGLAEQEAVAMERVARAQAAAGNIQQDAHVAAFAGAGLAEQKEFQEWLIHSKAQEAELNDSLHSARKQFLQEEAAAGNKAAALELQRMAIGAQFNAQRERLSAVLKSDLVTEEQRVAAEAMMVNLAKQEAQAMERAAAAQNKKNAGGSGFGESSALGLGLKTLQGAGAAAAIGIAANIFEDATGKAAALAGQLRAGEKSAEDFTTDLARSLPIFGNIVNGLENVHELIHGSRAEAAGIREEAERTNKVIDARTAGLKANAEAMADTAKIGDRLRLSLRDGLDKALESARQGYVETIKEINDTIENSPALKPLKEIKADLAKERQTKSATMVEGPGKAKVLGDIDGQLGKVQADIDKRTAEARGRAQPLYDDARRSREAAEREAINDQYEKRLDARKEFEGSLAEIEAAAREDRLRGAGKDYQADLEQARNAHAKLLQEAREKAEAERKLADPNDTDSLNRIEGTYQRFRGAADDQLRGNVEEANRKELDRRKDRDDKSRDTHDQIDKSLADQGQFIREQEAAAGRLGSLELERLKIAEEFNDKRRELKKILDDELATEDQKTKARELMGSLDTEEAAAKGRAKGSGEGARFTSAIDTRVGGDYFARQDSISRDLSETPEVKAVKEGNKLLGDVKAAVLDFKTAVAPMIEVLSTLSLYSGGNTPTS